jgi:Na+-driven multidrug efflux pump
MPLERATVLRIMKLGTASFIMQGTNCAVQVACNSMLQLYGGDIFVGIMTIVNSVREIFMLPVSGITGGTQPVLSFNYGAKEYDRVKEGIRFSTIIGAVYTLLAWSLVHFFPGVWFGIFSSDQTLAMEGTEMLRIYFFGFIFMAFQFAGQTTFQALGDAKHAIFFSLLRKIIIVVPLTLILPAAGFGVKGVFLAEPISNVIGGLACYTTMRLTAYRKLQ